MDDLDFGGGDLDFGGGDSGGFDSGSDTDGSDMFGGDTSGGFDDGGIEDCVDCYNDASIGGGISILALLAGAYGFFLTRRRKEQV